MKYQAIEQLQTVARLEPLSRRSLVPSRMSVSQRLERWANLLEASAKPVRLLRETEIWPVSTRHAMRDAASPIAVAFADEALRAQGLAGDTYGDAFRFFLVRNSTLHHIVCYCHYQGSDVSGMIVGARVREALTSARRVEHIGVALGMAGKVNLLTRWLV